MNSIQPALVATGVENWPGVLDKWFRALLRGELRPAPPLADEAWQRWLAAVDGHGLLPLLAHWLQSASAKTEAHLPPFVRARLQQQYTAAMTEATCRWWELNALGKSLARVGVRPLVLKGTALAESCYARPELRPSNDIDLLVRREEYQAARQALLADGYSLVSGDRSQQMEWNNQEAFVFGGQGVRQYMVELHWSLSPHSQILQTLPVELLFERAVTLADDRFGGVQVLCPADALVYAALHLIYGHYLFVPESIRLIWLYDIYLLARPIVDGTAWEDVLVSSQRLQARLALLDAFQLAEIWFGSPVPAAVADLTKYPPSALERKLHDMSRSEKTGRFKRHFLRLSGLSGREQLRYIGNRLFPDRHELNAAYPQLSRWPLPLVYLVRPFFSFRRK